MIVDQQVVELQSCVSMPAEVHHAWDVGAQSTKQSPGTTGAVTVTMSKAMQNSSQMPRGKRHWLWTAGQRLDQDVTCVRVCFAFLGDVTGLAVARAPDEASAAAKLLESVVAGAEPGQSALYAWTAGGWLLLDQKKAAGSELFLLVCWRPWPDKVQVVVLRAGVWMHYGAGG